MANPFSIEAIQSTNDQQSGNPYSLDTIQGDQSVALRSSLNAALPSNPDQAAKALQLSRATGLAPGAVEANLPEVAHSAALDAYEQMLAGAPTTRQFLTVPDNAKLAHDDVENLTGLERIVAPAVSTLRAIPAGLQKIAANLVYGVPESLMSLGSQYIGQPLVGTFLPEDPFARGQAAFNRWRKSGEQVGEQIAGAQPQGFVARSINSGAESFGRMLPGLAAAVVTKNPAYAIGAGALDQGNQSMLRGLEEGLSPTQSLAYGLQDATAEAVTEKIPIGRLIKDLHAGASVWKTLGHQILTETPTEMVATAWQNFNEWANLHPEKTLSDYLGELPEAEAQTVLATITTSVLSAGLGKGAYALAHRAEQRRIDAQQAEQNAQALTALDQLAQANKTRTRDAQTFQSFIAQAAEQGPVQDVYLSANDLAQSGVDPAKLAAASPSVAAQLPTAVATGGDVRIPVEEFATTVAGTDLAQGLIPHLRTDPNGFSQAQAQQYFQGDGEQLRQEVEQVLTEKQQDDAFKASRDAVRDDFQRQLDSVGRFTKDVNKAYATLAANFYAVTAAKLGITPQEMAERYPLRVQAEALPGAKVLEQEERPAGNLAAQLETEHEGLKLDLLDGRAGKPWVLSRIVVPEGERSSGIGSEVMQRIVDAADTAGRTVALTPSSDFGGNKKRLTEFYKRFGFVENKGKNKDYEISEAMYRSPKNLAVQQDGQGELQQKQRGSISLPDDITQSPSVITLLKDADASTFFHEMGHYFLEVYHDVASRENAPQEIKDDLNAVFGWFGDGLDAAKWSAMTLDEKRPYHEQFARGFEAFLFEGKSPSVEMQGLFTRFRAWFLNVYRSLTALNVELSDEVRGVFGRMLASSDAIQQQEALQAFAPMFATASEAGMSDAQFKAYHEQGVEATQDAISKLETRSLKDMQWLSNARSKLLRQLQRDAAEKRKAVRQEVEPEVMAEPVNLARRFLKRGEVEQNGEVIKAERGAKLSIAALKEMYPEGALADQPDWRALGYGKYGMLAEEGLHPDAVAAIFGFDSGDQLVHALLTEPPAKDRITALTDQRMLERYGDINSPAALARAVDEAIHNDLRTRFIVTEANALADAVGKPRLVAAAAKQFAEQVVSRLRVRDLKPGQFTNAEARAARAAEKARKVGDLATASTEKRNQVFQNLAAKAVLETRTEVDKAVRYLKKFERSGTRQNLRGEFLAQLDELLARFDLRSSQSLTAIDQAKRQALADWMQQEAERLAAPTPELAGFVLDETYRKSYKDLTVEELRGLRDSVKQLEHLARREQQAYLAQRNMTIQQEVAAGVAEMQAAYPEAFDGDDLPVLPSPLGHQYAPKLAQSLADSGGRLKAEFLPMETLVDLLTAGRFGQLHDSLFGRISHASDHKAELAGQIRARLKPAYDAYTLREKRDFARKEIPGTRMTRENLLMLALHYGNVEGRQRLASQGFNDLIVGQLLRHLSDKDMNLAEAIWSLNDDFIWPQYQALNERTRGIAPPKVQPAPMTINGRTLQGGYVKLVYDAQFDEATRGRDSMDDAMAMIAGRSGGTAKTNQGSSTQRIDELSRMPLLELRAVGQAVNEHIHDIAYREAVADMVRLLREPKLRDAIKAVSGNAVYTELLAKVNEVAARPMDPSGAVLKGLNLARKNTTIVLMSGVKTALVNYSGLIPALTRVNAGALTKAVAKVHSPRGMQMIRFAEEKSSYMRERNNAFTSDLQQQMDSLTVKSQILPSMSSFLILMRMVDRMTSTSVWLAAYEDGNKRFRLDDGTPDEARAIEYADSVTRTTQGSGRDVDTSKIQTRFGPWSKPFLMFYSYFNSQGALLVRQGVISERAWANGDRVKAVGLFAASYLAIVVVPALINDIAAGKCDDAISGNEGWTRCTAKAIAMNMAGFVPVVRDMAPYVWGTIDDKEPNFGLRMTALTAYFEGIGKGIGSAVKAAQGEAGDTDTKNIFMGMAFALGLPGLLMWNAITGTKEFADGEAGPQAIVFGAPKH